ncbi:YgjV family protein [Duganella sp. FT92W]|uniref:YgjV family protein n=1 Tax=Pseudoduganella rivuli TaxID=2666085 RepID=A0A7X2INN9_9BURK|nr:YgjV family protein [Pseudoduganella rivuli]
MDWFSPAQCVGYVAFVFGVGSFMQTDDRRFKLFMAAECLAYVIHFSLLGNPTAVASSSVSLLRSIVALRTRQPWVAAVFIATSIALGLTLARQPADWLPLVASCLGSYSLFRLQGIPMRLMMLCGTLLWVANNIVSGSIGGTALELVIAVVNLTTIARMVRRERAAAV